MGDPSKHGSAQSASCDDWCASEVFEVVHQNVTASRSFGWAKKCDWRYCGACSQCTTLLQETALLKIALLNHHRNPFAGWINKMTGGGESAEDAEEEEEEGKSEEATDTKE